MPVSAGEVEAVTRMKYVSDLKAGLKSDEADLKKFQSDYSAMLSGPTSNSTVIGLQGEMQAKIAATKAEIASLGGEVEKTSSAFGGLDAIIQRMLLRVGLLMAIRGAFNFGEEIFKTAADMDRLNQQFGIGTDRLGSLKLAGEGVNIPFEKITTAVQTFQKNISDFKGGEALHELGISFAEIFAQNPKNQLDGVMLALQGVGSQADRARYEYQLFGTDAIDPLVQKYQALTEAAEKSGDVMGPDTVAKLNNTIEVWKSFGGTATTTAGNIIAAYQDLIGAQYTFFTGGTQGVKDYIAMLDRLREASERAAASKLGPAPLMGQAYIDSLREGIKLSDEMIDKLGQLDRMHQLNAETAARGADADAAQLREFLRNKAAEIAAEREHDQLLMTSYRSRMQGLELTEKEGVATRRLMQDKAALLRIQSDLSDAELKTLTTIAPIADAKSHIQDLMAQDAAEKELMQAIIINLHSEQERAKVYADYGKVHEQIAQKIITEEERITKALTVQAEAARKARQERMNEAGLRLDSSATDSNLGPFDAASRHYAETLQEIDRLQSALALTESDASELRLQALREEQKAFDAANKAIYGLTSTTQLADSSLRSLAAGPGSTFAAPRNTSSFPQPYYGPPGPPPGAPLHRDGGPTREGMAYLHDSEYVVPENGALVMRGGGGVTINLTLNGVMASDRMALDAVINESVMRAAKSVRKFGSQ